MQYKGKHPPLLPKMPFCLLYLPPKLVCIHQNFLHRVYTNLNSSFLDPSFLEWRLGCKTCIVYTGLKLLFKSHTAIGFYVKTMSAHGSHLGWRSWSPDTILKVYYPRTIHAMFALNWLTGFRREDF